MKWPRGRTRRLLLTLAALLPIAAGLATGALAGKALDVRRESHELLNAGVAAYRKGDYATAVDALRRSAAMALNSFRAHFYLGLALIGVATNAIAESRSPRFPTTIALPTGFQPEGITIGSAPTAYFGSLADGDLYRVNLMTGRGEVFSQGPGTPSVGLKIDRRHRLFVAGGSGGDARRASQESPDRNRRVSRFDSLAVP